MKVFVSSFHLPKSGNTSEEFEDSFYPNRAGEMIRSPVRLAIADGATEGFLSGSWAGILTKLYCRKGVDSNDFQTFIERANADWNGFRDNYIRDRVAQKRPIRWFEEPGLEAGSFSTLLGISLFDSQVGKPGRWEAAAVGDSCMFHVREICLVEAFPLQHSSDFNNRPALIATNPTYNTKLNESLCFKSGDCMVDDQFYLMTDALAAWTLREHEAGQNPWSFLRDLDTRDQVKTFEQRVEELRTSGLIRNDDVTLVRFDINSLEI